jgi:hypothetical protein
VVPLVDRTVSTTLRPDASVLLPGGTTWCGQRAEARQSARCAGVGSGG